MSATLEPPATVHCSWCGKTDAGSAPQGAGGDGTDEHAACRRRLALVDPPRYCPACARRMVVQVDPVGWTARCSRHGETRSRDARR